MTVTLAIKRQKLDSHVDDATAKCANFSLDTSLRGGRGEGEQESC